jgi:hypothetical protein
VSTAQWRQVDLQTQLQTTRLDAEGADRRCFGIEQSIFAAPHTPRIRLLFAYDCLMTKEKVRRELGRVKWFLWHGNVFRADETLTDLMDEVDGALVEDHRAAEDPHTWC